MGVMQKEVRGVVWGIAKSGGLPILLYLVRVQHINLAAAATIVVVRLGHRDPKHTECH